MSEVFITYSWDSPEHEQRVLDLTNHLRTNGFDTVIDKGLSQNETATNFVKMMHKAMAEHEKVVVVLSQGYKTKAENFKGGVGEEYEILINDVKDHPTKYILASFEGRGDDIVPLGLKGRDIVDLSSSNGENTLFGKLMDHKKYEFAEVGKDKPKLDTVLVQPFEVASIHPIEIETPIIVPTGNAGFGGNKYNDIELSIKFPFKNTSKKAVEGFAYSISLAKQLDTEWYNNSALGGVVTFNEEVSSKVFPGQTVTNKQLKFSIDSSNYHQIIDSTLNISVFTDSGEYIKEFKFAEICKIKEAGKQHSDPVAITKEMFH